MSSRGQVLSGLPRLPRIAGVKKSPPRRHRKDIGLWIFAGFFLALIVMFLFWAEPLFLGQTGVKAQLENRAARLRGLPAEEVAASIAKMAKSFLDASKHASQMEVRVDETSSARIVYTLVLPWVSASEKIHRRRGGTTVRLTADLLKTAGAGGVGVVVNVRKKKKDSQADQPLGRAVFDPLADGWKWVPPNMR